MKHPLHPALVHFPVACWTLASMADALSLFWRTGPLQLLAAVLLALGCALGLLAATAGFIELLKLPANHPAERTAYQHMGLALTCFCASTTNN